MVNYSFMKIRITLFLLLATFGSVSGQKSNPALNNIQVAWQLINNFYVDSVDSKALAQEAIIAMLKKLDPHSVFIPSDEVKAMNEPLDGNFEGVGIEFAILDDTLTVVSTISGGPSQKVGVLSGDRIVAINGSSVAAVGIKNSDVYTLLRGKKGTVVTMSIQRKGYENVKDFNIVRDKIPINSVDAAYMISSSTGYIKISRFAATTHEEFKEAFKQLKKEKMKNLVLDLRGNGGGYLKTALDIADEFIESGKMLLYTQGASVPKQNFTSTRGGLWEDGQLILLIDEYSASASEIVAGALQDWDRGVIIGRRSFGKGLVQRPFTLPDGSEIRLTVAKYYTPSGRCIQKSYENGTSKYQEEIYNRYLHGELMNRDSIQYTNGTNYTTLENKRAVYGGGGIMPDIFVPLDTALFTPFYRDLFSSGAVNRFILKYMDDNRNKLSGSYIDFNDFEARFKIDNEIMERLTSEARQLGVDINNDQMKISEPLINLQIKALLARDLWGSCEYYQIVNSETPAVNKAILIIEDRNNYSDILSNRVKE